MLFDFEVILPATGHDYRIVPTANDDVYYPAVPENDLEDDNVFNDDLKEIEVKSPGLKAESALENVVGTQHLVIIQAHGHGGTAVFPCEDALHRGGLDGRGDVNVQSAGLSRYQSAEGVLELQLLTVV